MCDASRSAGSGAARQSSTPVTSIQTHMPMAATEPKASARPAADFPAVAALSTHPIVPAPPARRAIQPNQRGKRRDRSIAAPAASSETPAGPKSGGPARKRTVERDDETAVSTAGGEPGGSLDDGVCGHLERHVMAIGPLRRP